MKFLFAFIISLLLSLTTAGLAKTETTRSWLYLGVTLPMSDHWSMTIMPGHKYEFQRNGSESIDTFLYELFVGPTYHGKFGPGFLHFPVWYYYLGFPYKPSDSYHSNHNIAVLPTYTLPFGRLSISLRLFAHNTLYSGFYNTDQERWGYSLLLTEMLGIAYRFSDTWSIMTALELFHGMVEDQEAAPTSGAGFYRKGFAKSKWYIGFSGIVQNGLFAKINYILEKSFSPGGELLQQDHFLYLVLSYTIPRQKNK